MKSIKYQDDFVINAFDYMLVRTQDEPSNFVTTRYQIKAINTFRKKHEPTLLTTTDKKYRDDMWDIIQEFLKMPSAVYLDFDLADRERTKRLDQKRKQDNA